MKLHELNDIVKLAFFNLMDKLYNLTLWLRMQINIVGLKPTIVPTILYFNSSQILILFL